MVKDESSELCFTIVSHPLDSEADLALGGRLARRIAGSLGLSPSEQKGLTAAVTAYARDAVNHAAGGEITFDLTLDRRPQSLRVLIEDLGADADKITGPNASGVDAAEARSLPIEPTDGQPPPVSRVAMASSPLGGSAVRLSVDLPESASSVSPADVGALQTELLSEVKLDLLETVKRQSAELAIAAERIRTHEAALAAAQEKLSGFESLLRRPDNLLELAVGNLPEAVFLVNREARIEFANEPARTLTSDWGGDNFTLPEPLKERVCEAMVKGVDLVPTGVAGVLRRRFGAEERSFLPRVSLLRGESGELLGAVLTLSDVTEFHLLEDLKSDLLGTVSHEVKSPVTAIRMGLLLLNDERLGSLNDSQRELVTTAQVEVERLVRTLNNLLDVARFKGDGFQLSLSVVPPVVLLERAAVEMRQTADRSGVTLRIEAPPEGAFPTDIRIDVDLERMVYALNNLISNAIKHSPSGQLVRLGYALAADSQRVRFSVSDNGPGIPLKYHQLIFNRFARVPGSVVAGAGVGLTIVREFVQAHGGEVGLVGVEGPGCEFYFTLPIRSKPIEE